jgi:hypothetical protein
MSKPIDTITVPTGKGSLINASIWENEIDQGERSFTTYSVTIEKRYRDGEQWKSTKSFKASELLQVAFVADEAYRRTLQIKQVATC